MLEHIQTPALLIDEGKMHRNIRRMLAVKEHHGVNVRPHFKTHKSAYIAHEQMRAGASGMTVAKVSEAEVLLKNGVTDILIAHPLIETEKVQQLFPYMDASRLIFTVDSIEQANVINEAAASDGRMLEVWIKVNSGLNRCGVEPGEEVLELARFVTGAARLYLSGVYTHAGHSYGADSSEKIAEIARHEAEYVVQSAELCEENGIPIANRSVGSTPTFEAGAAIEGITEVRPGNAVFFDRVQIALGVAHEDEAALTVVTQLVSQRKDRLVFDGGSKAFTTEKGAHGLDSITGFGQSAGAPRLILTRLSEEHGIADLVGTGNETVPKLTLGEKIRFIPNHACTAVNLHDHYVLKRENGEHITIPVEGRGQSQ